MEHGGGRYLGTTMKIRPPHYAGGKTSIAEAIADLGGRPREDITMMGERPGQVLRHAGDAARIERLCGWKPQIAWEDGLRRTYDWYRDHRDHWHAQLWLRQIPVRSLSGKVELH